MIDEGAKFHAYDASAETDGIEESAFESYGGKHLEKESLGPPKTIDVRFVCYLIDFQTVLRHHIDTVVVNL